MNEQEVTVDFWLAGQFRVRRNGRVETLGRTLLHEVLALLLLRANSPVPVLEIIKSIWPLPGQANEGTVPPYIAKIRKRLEGMDCQIEGQRRRYILRIDPMRVDVLRFAALAERAETGEAERRRRLLDEAMLLCPDDALLTGFMRGWVQAAGKEHRTQWRVVAHRRNQCWLDAGEHERLLSVLRRERADRIDDQPLAEDYLLALYRSGYAAESLSQHTMMVQRLTRAGTPVQPRLRKLGQQIERQDPVLERVVGRPGLASPDLLPPPTGSVEGRHRVLRSIERHAVSREAVSIVGIYGAPGIGKTALANAFAQRNKERYSGGVLYANLGHARPAVGVATDQVVEKFLRALGVRGEDIPAERGARLVRYQELLRQRTVMVVLDDVGATEDVVPLLPTCPGSLVLVTSRNRLTALTARHGALAVVLGPLDHEASVELLNRLAGGRTDWSRSAAAEIARACGGHPLALCLAGARLATRPEETLTSLVKALSEPGHRIPALDQYAEPDEAVSDVIGWSYRGLPEPHARVFRMLSLSVCAEIDLSLAARLVGLSESAASEILSDLVSAHLATQAGNRYGMLDLVAEYAAVLAAQYDSDEDRGAALDRLYDHYCAVARAAAHELWPLEILPGPCAADQFAGTEAARLWLDSHRDDLLTAARHPAAAVRPHHVVDLAGVLFRYLDHGGYLDQAVALQRSAADAAASAGEEANAARALVRLGAVLVRRGQFGPAESALRESCERYIRAGDADGEATALGNLGRLAARQGAYDDAISYQNSALALFRASGQRLAEARTLTNLGIARKLRGDPEAALRDLEQARVISDELNSRDAAARAMGTMAGILRTQGRLTEAEQQCQGAVECFRDLGDRVGEATVLSILGLIRSDQGRHRQAVEMIEESLVTFTEIGDESGYVDAMLNLGTALLTGGRRSEAVRSHTEALERATALHNEGQIAQAHALLAQDYAAAPVGDADFVSARRHLTHALDQFRGLNIRPPAVLTDLSARLAGD